MFSPLRGTDVLEDFFLPRDTHKSYRSAVVQTQRLFDLISTTTFWETDQGLMPN